MAGTYAVDHTIISDGDGGTITELTGYTQSRNLTASDGEIFYRAIASHSINTRNAANSKTHLSLRRPPILRLPQMVGNVGL